MGLTCGRASAEGEKRGDPEHPSPRLWERLSGIAPLEGHGCRSLPGLGALGMGFTGQGQRVSWAGSRLGVLNPRGNPRDALLAGRAWGCAHATVPLCPCRVYEYQKIPPLINRIPVKARRTHVGAGSKSSLSPQPGARSSTSSTAGRTKRKCDGRKRRLGPRVSAQCQCPRVPLGADLVATSPWLQQMQPELG